MAENPPPFGLATARDGARLDGLFVTNLTPQHGQRLSYFWEILGAETVQVTCQTEAGHLPATSVVGKPRARLDTHALGGIEEAAAEEIMGYFGEVPAELVRRRLPMILSRAAARQAADTPKPADVRSAQPHNSVSLLAQDTPHAGFFLTRTYQLHHPKFDGSTSAALTREAFIATDAAIVLPYDPVRDRVLLVEQFRMGPYARGDARPWMLEPVAGRVDAGESPETCARRECEEEAGLALHQLIKISSHYCSPGCSSEYFHLFLGLCELPDDATGYGGLETEHEDIRLHVLDYARAMTLLDSGEADNGPLVLSLLWLSQRRDALRGAA